MIQLLITLTDERQVAVQGPIEDKLLSYAMLELARDAILQHHVAKANGSGIVSAHVVPKIASPN